MSYYRVKSPLSSLFSLLSSIFYLLSSPFSLLPSSFQNSFFHIIDSTGFTVRWVYLADTFLL